MSIDPIFKISLDNYTPLSRTILEQSYSIAEKHKHSKYTLIHLLISILLQNQGVLAYIFEKSEPFSNNIFISKLEQELEHKFVKAAKDVPTVSSDISNFLKNCELKALTFGYSHVAPEHLLLTLYSSRTLSNLLSKNGLPEKKVLSIIYSDLDPAYIPLANHNIDKNIDKAQTGNNLDNFGKNLTIAAENNELDPVIGRQAEISRIIQILCRRTKNNPVLLGDAGVGKTAIIEGLAQAIANRKVPKHLYNKQIFSIDLARLVAGTKYRGQFEERLKALMDEVMKNENAIIFIDEIHTLVGAGGTEGGSMDASNIMKPPLSRGEIQCIGATTLGEYRKTIEKDSALARRFQSVIVDPPSKEETLQILQGIQPLYEKHHNVKYSKEVLQLAIDLSVRFITSRNLPDKAIDIIDEAASEVTTQETVFENKKQLLAEKKLKTLEEKKQNLVFKGDFSGATKIAESASKLLQKIQLLEKENDQEAIKVTAIAIRKTVAKMTGIPIEDLKTSESEKLLQMESMISKEVVGQTEAISAICRALRRSKADLKDPNRPIASFIFVGNSGTGKTLLANVIAKYLFENNDSLIRFDMSEFYDKHTASRLIGSPPGYEGSQAGGQLTEQVRRKPYSVILFDEIEKAHPDVLQILLQILEDGQASDSVGVKVDFRNTIIIMTSNTGATLLNKNTNMVFVNENTDVNEQRRQKIEDELKKTFRPEFLNRIDDIIYFKPLEEKQLTEIATIEIDKLQKRLINNRNINLSYSSGVLNLIAADSLHKNNGARILRKNISNLIEYPLADAILRRDFNNGETILLSEKNGKIVFAKKKKSITIKS